ncbi:hypothetical protein [Borrelia sp. RT1S]|uniref:hypothetical protein n=1 Tax=Borrelia sp. RT1S TaxID=2898580 RepID=UPI001E476F49|nr:hypothetical protein [Borrelia sp. RT1S]UGQ17631.1 hypothetical protein LSO05_04480 [Borrelia sp. RT1S]
MVFRVGLIESMFFLRAVEESCVIAQSLPMIYLFKFNEINRLTLNSLKNSFNLDDNFLYYSNLNEIPLKDSLLNSITDYSNKLEIQASGAGISIENELDMCLNILRSVSEYAVYCDITPLSWKKTEFKSIRILCA